MLLRLRALDLAPAWGHSSNWNNGGYDPLDLYLVGRLSPQQYQAQAGAGYYFKDVYGFGRMPAAPADFSAIGGDCYFTANAYHALSAKYFATLDSVYLTKYLALGLDLASNERRIYLSSPVSVRQSRKGCANIETGDAGSLLVTGSHLLAIEQSLAVMAKAVDRLSTANRWGTDSVAPAAGPLTPAMQRLFPADDLYKLGSGLVTSYAPDLLKYYGPPGYIPNQRLTGLVSLGLLSHVFALHPQVRASQGSIDAAINQAIAQTAQQDGGLLEPSFNYNDGSVRELGYLSRIPGRSWTASAGSTARGFGLMAAALASPQGGLPQVGNSLWSNGTAPGATAFTQTSFAFPYSGYYVQRSDWTADAAYLFFYRKRLARGHTMSGDNSIQLGAFGRRLLVAGGIPNYGGVDANYPASVAYRSEVSTFKTSTIVVDGKSQLPSTDGIPLGADGKPDPNRLPSGPIASRWSSSPTFDVVEGMHSGGYAGLSPQDVTHWRSVVFLRKLQAWVVVDVLRSPGNHTYTQIWKFAMPRISSTDEQLEGFTASQVLTSDSQRWVHTNDTARGAVNLSLRQFGATMNYRTYFGSDHGAYGYYGSSFAAGPDFSPDVHATLSGTGDQVVITVLRPFKGGADDGLTSIRDLSAGTVAGVEFTIGGTQVSVRSSAALATLAADGQVAPRAQLLLVQRSAEGTHAIVLGDPATAGGSFEADSLGHHPIVAPTAFSWSIDGAGRYTAAYQ